MNMKFEQRRWATTKDYSRIAFRGASMDKFAEFETENLKGGGTERPAVARWGQAVTVQCRPLGGDLYETPRGVTFSVERIKGNARDVSLLVIRAIETQFE